MVRLSVVTLLCLLITSCGSSNGPNSSTPSGSIVIEPNQVRAVIGQEVRFEVLETFRSEWSSSNTSVATLTRFDGPFPIFTCHAPGKTTITVTKDGQTGTASLEVIPSGTWERVGESVLNTYLPFWLGEVQFINTQYGWAVGNATGAAVGVVTGDGGQTWRESVPRTLPPMRAVSFVDENVGWIGGGQLFRTTDGGASWLLINDSIVQSLAFLDQNTGFMASGISRLLLKTTSAGLNWTQVSGVEGFVDKVLFIDKTHGWAAGDFVHRTTDGGNTWTRGAPRIGFGDLRLTPFDLNFRDRDNGWVVIGRLSFGGTLYRTQDGGATFTRATFPNPFREMLRGVYFASDGSGWSVTAQGSFVQTADDGAGGAAQGNRKRAELAAVRFMGNFGYAFANGPFDRSAIFIYRPN